MDRGHGVTHKKGGQAGRMKKCDEKGDFFHPFTVTDIVGTLHFALVTGGGVFLPSRVIEICVLFVTSWYKTWT
jgi:hypothetical protein